ncbi:hypothetical protein JX266_006070 [Neoarthrinium moseri]|nr:hypothetical protein JX266_006070 [Neoarthrinium moseri]
MAVYVSKIANADEYGWLRIADESWSNPWYGSGTESDAESDAESEIETESGHSPEDVPAYRSGDGDIIAVPFHAVCYELLKRVIEPDRYDMDILYETFNSLSASGSRLTLDYGAIEELQGQFWEVRRGTEEFVSHPLSIPRLREYYTHLPERNDPSLVPRGLSPRKTTGNAPLERMPTELMLIIMSHLDIYSFNHLREASRQAAQIRLDNAFWKHRLFQDMPWLFDFPVDSQDGSSLDTVNWFRVYSDLYQASDSSSSRKIHALANRRRIWGLCEHIAMVYRARKSNIENGRRPEILDGALSTDLALLVSPEPEHTAESNIPLVNLPHDIMHSTPVILVRWTENGELARLEVVSEPPQHLSPLRDVIQLGHFNWLSGVVLTSVASKRDSQGEEIKRVVCGIRFLFDSRHRIHGGHQINDVSFGKTEGDQRLLEISQKQALVGFKVHTSSDGTIAKLALLGQPRDKLPYGSRYRFLSLYNSPDNERIGQYLWKGEPPPLALRISDLCKGYYVEDLAVETTPMEALVFGDCEDELGDIVSIGADAHLESFEIRYATRNSRSIGPRRHAMQYLSIDGRGGERVTCAYWSNSESALACRFVTNRGRQLVVGFPSEFEQRYPSLESKDEGCILAGIFGHWISGQYSEEWLVAFGNLYLPGQSVDVNPAAEALQDRNGFNWMPNPLPQGVVESGTILGQREICEEWSACKRKYPGPGAIVSWLDCRHPLEEVTVTWCHARQEQRLPLAAIHLTLADKDTTCLPEATAVGLQLFRKSLSSTEVADTNEGSECWCDLESLIGHGMRSTPHYVLEIWQVEGRRLQALRVWLAEDGYLIGLQFTATDGLQSPKWGTCDGIFTTNITFMASSVSDSNIGDAQQLAVGVKFYLDNNDRVDNRPDPMVMAVEALIQDESR